MSKLPSELALIVTRELSDKDWELDFLMKIIEREVDARERSSGGLTATTRKTNLRTLPTAMSLINNSHMQVNCVYCNQPHTSVSCRSVTTPERRKQILQKSGQCFVCLRRNHISRNCRSSVNCSTCNRRHHTSICSGSTLSDSASNDASVTSSPRNDHSSSTRGASAMPTTSMYVEAHTSVLLKTAKATVFNYDNWECHPTSELYSTWAVREPMLLLIHETYFP